MLGQIVNAVGANVRIVMGGYSMAPEEFYVFTAQNKRLRIYFASGESPDDMKNALQSIADGSTDVSLWLTGPRIGLSQLGDALEHMTDPAAPIRTIVDPRL